MYRLLIEEAKCEGIDLLMQEARPDLFAARTDADS